MLEKQFGFSSSETGFLMSCNDIGYLSCVIFAGYIARKVSDILNNNDNSTTTTTNYYYYYYYYHYYYYYYYYYYKAN